MLEAHLPKNICKNRGHRVDAGQRLMQATSDIFLGWLRGKTSRDYYWRQLRDMKGSAKIERMSSEELVLCAGLCGWALAQAHARSGERFTRAIGDFAEAYANQTERDHAALCAAVESGRLAEGDVGA